jgi:hypothetical protein
LEAPPVRMTSTSRALKDTPNDWLQTDENGKMTLTLPLHVDVVNRINDALRTRRSITKPLSMIMLKS